MQIINHYRYIIFVICSIILVFVLLFLGCKFSSESAWRSYLESEAAEQADTVAEEELAQQEVERKVRTVFVHVCGAVQKPGLVEVPEGSRVMDALNAAGGYDNLADTNAVNLARVVKDGEQIYFPCQGEAELLKRLEENPTININLADEEELCNLPGIGESRAKDIITYRENHGPFEAIEDIMKVPGIKEAMYERIKSSIAIEDEVISR